MLPNPAFNRTRRQAASVPGRFVKARRLTESLGARPPSLAFVALRLVVQRTTLDLIVSGESGRRSRTRSPTHAHDPHPGAHARDDNDKPDQPQEPDPAMLAVKMKVQ